MNEENIRTLIISMLGGYSKELGKAFAQNTMEILNRIENESYELTKDILFLKQILVSNGLTSNEQYKRWIAEFDKLNKNYKNEAKESNDKTLNDVIKEINSIDIQKILSN